MPLDESDSHVKVNCVFVGVVFSFSFSKRLTLPGPRGGEESVAALAIAVEMIPWSEDSPGTEVRANNAMGKWKIAYQKGQGMASTRLADWASGHSTIHAGHWAITGFCCCYEQ